MQLTKQGAVLFAQGSHKRFRSQSTQHAGQTGGHAPYLIVCEDMRRAWPRAQTTETFGSRKPLRTRFGTLSPLATKYRASACSPLRAVSRAMRFRQRTQPCRERMRGCAVDDALGHRSGRISARTRAFFGSCRGNPSQTLATKRNRPRTQREGRPEGPPSLEARCPLKRARAISRGAVPRAGRSA